jgi:ABC-type uncharacterized transport system substrate-binding protein
VALTIVALTMLTAAGCSLIRPAVPSQPIIIEPELPPAVATQAVVAPAQPPIVIVPRVELEPEPDPVVPTIFSQRVAIVLSGRQGAYDGVAKELEQVLTDYSLYDFSDRSQTVRGIFQNIADEQAIAVIAIGLRAALSARALSTVPVVFCQVFNVSANDLITDNVRGVSSIPPLELQLRAWKELNPSLTSVGAIIGAGHESLIDEAMLAAEELGLEMHVRVAGSDKETLYVFNRLIPDIDGFLLFPDNRILSRTVLEEMLGYASRHRVQVAVFNESLLAMGAALSATAIDADIASTIVRVLDRFEKNQVDHLPALTPLSEIEIRTNKTIIQQYGQDDSEAGQSVIAGAL